jgi:glycosyltransferase involved in cell wall biosynthesis
MLGEGPAKAALKTLADTCGVRHRVHFLEPVPQDELLKWTASADVGIIPYPPIDLNHRLCSPNKLFEFIQAGLPILANDLPFLRQLIDGEQIGMVAPLSSPSEFRAAIASVFQDSERLARWRARLAAIRQRYSWHRESQRLLAIYDSLRGRSSRKAA